MEQILKESIFKIEMIGKQADDVANFYKKIIKELTSKNVQVRVDEISNGRYGVEVVWKEQIFWMISKAWDGLNEVTNNIKEAIAELNLFSGFEEEN